MGHTGLGGGHRHGLAEESGFRDMGLKSSSELRLEDRLGKQGEGEWQRLRDNLKQTRPSWLTFLYSASLHSSEVMRQRLEAALQQEGKSLKVLRAESPFQLARLPEVIARPSKSSRSDHCWIEVSGSEAARSDNQFWRLGWQDFLASLQGSFQLAKQHFPGGLIVSALPRIQEQVAEYARELPSQDLLVLEPLPKWLRPRADEPAHRMKESPSHRSAQGQRAPSVAINSRIEPQPPKKAEMNGHAQQLLDQARQLFLKKQFPQARLSCQQALSAFEASSDSPSQARAHYWLARLERASANPALALHHIQLALGARDESLSAERVKWHDLAAQMHLQAGDARQAMKYCRKGVALASRLAQAHPETPSIQRDHAVILSRQADAHLKASDAESALACYRKSLHIRRRLMRKSPRAQTMRDLSYALYVLGQMHLRRGELQEAHKLTEESLFVDRKIIERFGATRPAVRDYAASLHLTAGILDRLGRSEPAKIRRRQAEQLEKRLKG